MYRVKNDKVSVHIKPMAVTNVNRKIVCELMWPRKLHSVLQAYEKPVDTTKAAALAKTAPVK
jgi:hypothetical protein